MTPSGPAYVLLEDGTRFDGLACGADDCAVGEIVFTTSMSGYQEAVSDPSYAGQLIVFTYPQIGNYGVSAEAMESDRVHARAAIMRAGVDRDDARGAQAGWLSWLTDCGVPAITDLDTRALVRHIRDAGAMRGGVFPGRIDPATARGLIEAEPPMTGRDLAREVGTRLLVSAIRECESPLPGVRRQANSPAIRECESPWSTPASSARSWPTSVSAERRWSFIPAP